MRVGGLSIPVDLLPLGIAESDRGHEKSEPHLSRAEARVVYEATPHRRQRATVEPKFDEEPLRDSIACAQTGLRCRRWSTLSEARGRSWPRELLGEAVGC